MKKRVAVIQFPGINSEYETRRALWDADMDAEFFRWNDDPRKLEQFDGFVIAGGFSYEDRGRAGLIASMEPIMDEIKIQAAKGKPILGICNGAQILVESGLVPGSEDNELLMCLARNKRVKDGEILGVGFYNENVYIKPTPAKNRTAFTLDYDMTEIEFVPVAHGEGRFTTRIDGLMETLQENNQIIFRYCTKEGEIDSNFPTNPNGALDNAAAISNPQGNVMAIMPHPERGPKSPMPKIFTSMRRYMEGAELENTQKPLSIRAEQATVKKYSHKPNTIELYVEMIITDNEAQTIENALRLKGFNAFIRKWTHYEIEHEPGINQEELSNELIASGELLNTNKETVTVVTDGMEFAPNNGRNYFLVRDIEDSVGASKTAKIHHHLGKENVKIVHRGWFWELSGDVDINEVLTTNIFANHHAQEMWWA